METQTQTHESISALETEIDKVEIIENIDNEGTYQVAKHRGITFQITNCPDNDEAEYKFFEKNHISDCSLVVFLGMQIPKKFKEPILAHEVAESIYDGEFNNGKEAHEYGIKCERVYAEKFLDAKTRAEFYDWIRTERLAREITDTLPVCKSTDLNAL